MTNCFPVIMQELALRLGHISAVQLLLCLVWLRVEQVSIRQVVRIALCHFEGSPFGDLFLLGAFRTELFAQVSQAASAR